MQTPETLLTWISYWTVCQEIEKYHHECSRFYVLRGKHLLKLGLFDAARKDFETARTVEGFEECSKFIEDAKAQRKKSVNQNHYEILGVSQTASTKEILKAFRALPMNYHPDRHGGEPKFIQDGFVWRFKRVNYAKTVLTDEKLRKSYDEWIRPKSGKKDQRHRWPKRVFNWVAYNWNPGGFSMLAPVGRCLLQLLLGEEEEPADRCVVVRRLPSKTPFLIG
ncbi:dnaJ homolog subfamily C member 7-like [Palaemon carinicauda]|uniref:dnaJ homolog subfamily C member 7-like n=1 Tax=Palaemon carinicauda TaxID=392227 RepID=UPI0035B685AB